MLEHDGEQWLINQIHRDLQDASAGIIARGLTLAGMLETSTNADALWAHELDQPPAAGWLSRVHAEARLHYKRRRWAYHWLNEFLATPDWERAYGYFWLLSRCIDEISMPAIARRFEAADANVNRQRRAHFKLRRPHFLAEVRADGYGSRTLCGKPIEHGQQPWLDRSLPR